MPKLISYALVAIACLLSAGTQAEENLEVYRLRHGDSVLVSVWREEGLQKEIRVLPDGSITFPLAGRLAVAGLSSTEVERQLAVKLKEYIPDPVVSVIITGIEGSRVYVLGKVLKPGPVILSAPTTVLQALSQSGGLDKFADGDLIRIIRVTSNGQEVLPVRYNDLLKGKDLGTNVQLRAGDTILVP
jgi:polysaccharide export outer membrane protein